MALNNNAKTLATRFKTQRAEPETEPEGELEQLELEVKKMAEKILEYRATFPDQLKTTLDSTLSTQSPHLSSLEYGSEPGPSREHNADEEAGLEKKQQIEERMMSLKEKISSNISAMPVLIKRTKDCVSMIEKLDSYNVTIMHPAFKKRKVISPRRLDS